MIEAFGDAISQIFKDSGLKEKANELSGSAVKSAETFTGTFQDEDVRGTFRDTGKAAQDFVKAWPIILKMTKYSGA